MQLGCGLRVAQLGEQPAEHRCVGASSGTDLDLHTCAANVEDGVWPALIAGRAASRAAPARSQWRRRRAVHKPVLVEVATGADQRSRHEPLTARHRSWAASSSLNAMARPRPLLPPGQLVTCVLSRTDEKSNSLRLLVSRPSQCSAAKSNKHSTSSA